MSIITIGITAFNAAETVGRAVSAAFAQDWPVVEVIVVDDASTDHTADILQDVQKQYPALSIFQQSQNRGVAAARNRIIKEAKGDFVAFFDDDDESTHARLRRQYERITRYEQDFAHGAPVICHTARLQIYPDGTKRYEPTMGTQEDRMAPHGPAVAQRILTGRPFPGVFGSAATCSQMARASVYRDLGGFDPAFRRSEDTEFNVRLALAGGHFAGIAGPLVTQAMTLTGDKKLAEERGFMLKLLEKHKHFIALKSDYDFCRDWINAKYDFLAGRRGVFAAKLAGLFCTHPVETVKRLYRALPNTAFNMQCARFYDS